MNRNRATDLMSVTPLVAVRSKTPKVGQTCLLKCGHIVSHKPTDMACEVRRHRCSACRDGKLPMMEVVQ